MRDQKLYESVGKYIDKYYIDKPDDIKLDKEMKSIFDRISEFRKKKATKKCNAEEDTDIEIDESAVESFDVESMQKMKATDAMSSTLATNRNIESLMGQMDETFSQRLLRLIDERGMTDSEAYNKAYVDRRHFSLIKRNNLWENVSSICPIRLAILRFVANVEDIEMCIRDRYYGEFYKKYYSEFQLLFSVQKNKEKEIPLNEVSTKETDFGVDFLFEIFS